MKGRAAFLLFGTVLGAGCHRGYGGGAAPPVPAAVAPAAAAAAAGPSLYTRLGGLDAIRAVVADFHGRMMADARISSMFRGADAEDFKGKLTDQICQATGGPCVYRGRSMRAAHTGMNITNEQFDALVGDLVAALNHFNVPQPEQSELLGILGGLRGEIVGH